MKLWDAGRGKLEKIYKEAFNAAWDETFGDVRKTEGSNALDQEKMSSFAETMSEEAAAAMEREGVEVDRGLCEKMALTGVEGMVKGATAS